MTGIKRKILGLTLAAFTLVLCGCVDQGQGKNQEGGTALKAMPNARIVATSVATVEICNRLNLDLVGVPHSDIATLPSRYKAVAEIGTPMAPDMEVVANLKPDWILGPSSLQSDLEPKFEAIGCDYAFLNLKSVQGMYKSILELGKIFNREKEAAAMEEEFEAFYNDYRKNHTQEDHPKVLILMGLPGSYLIATENSYVGNLVALAGGDNVYGGTDKEFININTEDMKTKEPDIILRTSHAMPEQVMAMFAKDFETNDIWQHFDAVKNGRVYDLPNTLFGMSAGFGYPQALAHLEPILYPGQEATNEE